MAPLLVPPPPYYSALESAQLSRAARIRQNHPACLIATLPTMDYEEKQWILVNMCGQSINAEAPTPSQKKDTSEIAESPSKQKR